MIAEGKQDVEIARLAQPRVFAGAGWMALCKLGSQIFSWIGTFYVASRLSPTDYGLSNLSTAFTEFAVILTNLGQDDEVQRCVGMGAVDYLIKNDARPADVSERISAILKMTCTISSRTASYRLQVRDREGDADRFIADACLVRRLWCPACEVELNLELTAQPNKPGWYDAHVICAMCGREY